MYGCARVCMYVRACAYVCVGVGVSGDLVILISVDETQIEGRVDLVLCCVGWRRDVRSLAETYLSGLRQVYYFPHSHMERGAMELILHGCKGPRDRAWIGT